MTSTILQETSVTSEAEGTQCQTSLAPAQDGRMITWWDCL